jgi:hypothetical protein
VIRRTLAPSSSSTSSRPSSSAASACSWAGIDLRAGLPASAGHNAAILDGSLMQAEARIVRTEQEIPQIGRCMKMEGVKEGKTTVFGGRFSSANCVTEAVESLKPGRYEWSPGPGANRKFSGTLARVTLETVGKARVLCGSGAAHGEFTGQRTEAIALVLSGCESTSLHQSCQSASAAAGEIRTSPLSGELGLINDVEPVKPTVGLDLRATPQASKVASFLCAGHEQVVQGSVIGPVTADVMTAAPTLQFKAAAGHQIPESFEGLAPDTLTTTTSAGSEQSALIGGVKIGAEERIEVKARAF